MRKIISLMLLLTGSVLSFSIPNTVEKIDSVKNSNFFWILGVRYNAPYFYEESDRSNNPVNPNYQYIKSTTIFVPTIGFNYQFKIARGQYIGFATHLGYYQFNREYYEEVNNFIQKNQKHSNLIGNLDIIYEARPYKGLFLQGGISVRHLISYQKGFDYEYYEKYERTEFQKFTKNTQFSIDYDFIVGLGYEFKRKQNHPFRIGLQYRPNMLQTRELKEGLNYFIGFKM